MGEGEECFQVKSSLGVRGQVVLVRRMGTGRGTRKKNPVNRQNEGCCYKLVTLAIHKMTLCFQTGRAVGTIPDHV